MIKNAVKEKFDKKKEEKEKEKKGKEKEKEKEKEKQMKIQKILDKLREDFETFLDENEVKAQIESFNFKEKDIKEWIRRKKASKKSNKARIEELYKNLEETLYISQLKS